MNATTKSDSDIKKGIALVTIAVFLVCGRSNLFAQNVDSLEAIKIMVEECTDRIEELQRRLYEPGPYTTCIISSLNANAIINS